MNLIDLPPGIHENVPAEVYHQRVMGVVNTGALKVLHGKTPAHYRAWLEEEPDEESKALEFGRALHCAMLEPAIFDATYVQPVEHPYRRPTAMQRNAKKPSDATLAAIGYWDAWNAANAGMIEITVAEKRMIQGMAAAVMAHPEASILALASRREVTVIWTDRRTGLLCKARYDLWDDRIVVIGDVKSTEDATPSAFSRSVARYGYHIQDAHYLDGARSLGFTQADFVFIAVEKEPPHGTITYRLNEESRKHGHELRYRAMDTLAECIETDRWPGYESGIQNLSLPAWAFQD